MSQNVKQDLDQLARLQQMKINTRLTALQAAQQLMATHGYLGVTGTMDGVNVMSNKLGVVDHITLLAIATDIENYILGNIETETKEALDAAALKLNAPRIVRP